MSDTNHGSCALKMPHAYEGQVVKAHDRDQMWTVIEAATYFELPPLLRRIGDWAICISGLYCLTTSYPIAAHRFDEDWAEHMK